MNPILTALVRALLLVCATASAASAGGMFLPARGARPLGRAGSFVAGADDLEAAYYNVAGLGGTGDLSLMLDVGLVFQQVHYDRVDSGGNALPGVDDTNGVIPIPLIGLSWRPEHLFGRRVTFAVAAYAPYSGVPQYLGQDGKPRLDGPQRYSLVSLNGTTLLVAELAASVRITNNFFVGASLQNMFGHVQNVVVLSGCTEFNCAREDTRFDSPAEAAVDAPFTPSASFGAIALIPNVPGLRHVRIGASFQLPYWLHGQGTIKARLPSDPQFNGASIVGNAVSVDLTLPWVARLGVEVRPLPTLRVELGGDYEAWSMQQELRFTPHDVYIDNVAGIGRYYLKPLAIDRSMQDVISVHLGGELDVWQRRLTLRAGYLFESSAVPDKTLSVLTPDGDKHLVAVGASLHVGRVRFDLGYAHIFQADRTVTMSQSLQLNPIQPGLAVPVGNGTYKVADDLLTLGAELRL